MLRWIVPILLVLSACDAPRRQGRLPLATPAAPPPPAVATLRLEPAELPAGATSLTFGVTPYMDRAELAVQMAPIVSELSRAAGLPVRLVLADSYADLVRRVVAHQVDLSLLSPLSYVEAKQQAPDLQLLARTLSYGAPDYSSFVLVRTDDPAEGLADLRGRRIAWVDPLSATGFLFPAMAFLRAGLDPWLDLQATFAGTHTEALRLLHERRVDAAAISSGTLAEDQTGAAADVKILATAGRIPYDAVCARGDLSASAALKLASAFQRIDTRTPAGRSVLAKMPGISGWIAARDADYDHVRAAVRELAAHQADAGQVRKALDALGSLERR